MPDGTKRKMKAELLLTTLRNIGFLKVDFLPEEHPCDHLKIFRSVGNMELPLPFL